MEKKIAVSAIAHHFYTQAEGSEIQAIVAYAFDTITLEKKEFDAYNKDGAERLSLSLKTMRNRATAGRALQTKYALQIARYESGLDVSSVSDFARFLRDEMALAGSYRNHAEDICGFLAGQKPAHVQRQEAADKAAEVRSELARVKAAKDIKEAADKAAREADKSGTVEAEAAKVPEVGVIVGEADSAAERNPAPSADIEPVVPVLSSVDYVQGYEDAVASFLFTIERDPAHGGLIVEGLENLDVGELEILIKSFKTTIASRKAELKKAA